MKRTPIRRKSALRRKARPKPRKTSAYARRPRDIPYMSWIRSKPCAAGELFAATSIVAPCDGRVEADHVGRRPIGRKADDRTCVPMCQHHHRQRDNFHGPFRVWSGDQMREWLAGLVIAYQEMYANR